MIHFPTPDAAALRQLEQILHTEIPLTRAMGIAVSGFDARGLHLAAPLAPNINHKHTAFGGSLATLTTVAGWGLLQLLVRGPVPITVVIQESSVRYRRPVTGNFTAVCALPDDDRLKQFTRQLQRKGLARISLAATIASGPHVAVEFEGQFVAIDKIRYPAIHPDRE